MGGTPGLEWTGVHAVMWLAEDLERGSRSLCLRELARLVSWYHVSINT